MNTKCSIDNCQFESSFETSSGAMSTIQEFIRRGGYRPTHYEVMGKYYCLMHAQIDDKDDQSIIEMLDIYTQLSNLPGCEFKNLYLGDQLFDHKIQTRFPAIKFDECVFKSPIHGFINSASLTINNSSFHSGDEINTPILLNNFYINDIFGIKGIDLLGCSVDSEFSIDAEKLINIANSTFKKETRISSYNISLHEQSKFHGDVILSKSSDCSPP